MQRTTIDMINELVGFSSELNQLAQWLNARVITEEEALKKVREIKNRHMNRLENPGD